MLSRTGGRIGFCHLPPCLGRRFLLLYDVAVRITLSDEPQLLAVNLVPRVLTDHYFVDMLPQPDRLSVEENFVASGRQVVPYVDVAGFEPGNLFGGIHILLMHVPLEAFHDDARGLPSGPHTVSVVSESPLSVVAATASP